MASLASILSKRLEKLRLNSDSQSWQARCPCCAAAGRDTSGEHLRVYKSGAFSCVVDNSKEHNRFIRSYVYDGVVAADLAEVTIIDPEPKLDIDPVYPEELLKSLTPDYSYWRGRGISDDVLQRLEGGLYPRGQHGKMEGRFVLPVRHHQPPHRIMGWTGRLVNSASFGPKHKHLVKSSRAVYPLTVTREAILRARKVVLLESVGDMLACMTAGIDCVLVLFGLNLNSRIIGFLVGANLTEVIISTNKDEAKVAPDGTVTYPGQEAAAKARAKLVPYLGEDVVRIRLPEHSNDWGDDLEKRGGAELAEFKKELGL